MAPLFNDKVLAVAVAASATIHLAVISGVPDFRTSGTAPAGETYIEFLYYQMHSDQVELEAMGGVDESGEPAPVEAETVELRDVGLLSIEDAGAGADALPAEVERVINVRVNKAPPSSRYPRAAGIFKEGRLINEYARTLDNLIERYGSISYPERPRGRMVEGSVLINFRVSRDGSLRSAETGSGDRSGGPEFEAAAIEAVKRASDHFPPFPEGLRRKEILFTLPVSFTLER